MDPILQVLLSWQFVLFGLAIAAVMYVFRLTVEYVASVAKKDLSKSNFWNNFLLPVAPILFGVVAAILLKKFPYPGFTPDVHGIVIRGDRIIFGLVTGMFSTLMYRMIKSLLYQKLVTTVQSLNLPGVAPTAPAPVVTPTAPVVVPAPAPAPIVTPPVTATPVVTSPDVAPSIAEDVISPDQLPPKGQV